MPNNSREYHRHYRKNVRPLNDIWASMKQRCYNPKAANYRYYGARGITVCARWRRSYEAFEQDMGPRPAGTSIDRIDSSGPYSPENCRWATPVEQSRNRRTSRTLSHAGRTMSVAEWADEIGISSVTIRSRIDKYGWTVDDALDSPRCRKVVA